MYIEASMLFDLVDDEASMSFDLVDDGSMALSLEKSVFGRMQLI